MVAWLKFFEETSVLGSNSIDQKIIKEYIYILKTKIFAIDFVTNLNLVFT